jgi:glycosyltransferase involved in cell wall biosynthesis
VTQQRPAGVRWISWLPGDGFGDAALGYLTALDALGVPLTWTLLELGGDQPVDPRGYDGPLAHLVGRAIDHDTVVVHLPPGAHDRWRKEAGGRRTLLCTTWESDRLPDDEVDACAAFDEVLVPSTFNRDVFLASGCPTPVHVVPQCARPVSPVEPARFERIGDRFAFYTIGTWTTRKAMPETVTAFLDAFDADDDVALIVKTTAVDQQAMARVRRGLPVEGPSGRETAVWPAFASLLGGRRAVPAIQLIADQVPRRQVDALHVRGDCFFSLTRSEGWGLNIADALLFGHPVVVTGWGGQLDYLGADYPLLVDYDLVPTASDPPDDWFSAGEGHRWARARHDHAVDLLRWVADNRNEADVIGKRVGTRLAHDFAPDVIGRRLLSLVEPS